MEDIEKLCEDLRRVYEFHGWDFSKQAADAIEQIQGKCRTWETNANHWNAEYRKLQAENERIRSNCYARDAVQAIIDERDMFKAERDAAQAMLDGQPLCNAGDMVYTLLLDEECYYPHTHGWYIYPERVGAIGADGFYTGRPEDGVYYRFAQIGKRVFLTKEEAEAALKGENHEADPV
jgi:hypothetical protein